MWTTLLALASTALAGTQYCTFKVQGGPNSGATVQVSGDKLTATGNKPWTYTIIDSGLVLGQSSCQGLVTFASDKATLAISHGYDYNGAMFQISDQKLYLNGVNNFYQCTGSGNTFAWAYNSSSPAGCSGATKVELLAYDNNGNAFSTGGDSLSEWGEN